MDIARETRDPEGHKVIDYFKPFTEADIKEQFERTSCTYDKAFIALSCQAGEIDEPNPKRLRISPRYYTELEIELGIALVNRVWDPENHVPEYYRGDLTSAAIDCVRTRNGLPLCRRWCLYDSYWLSPGDIDYIRYTNMTLGYNARKPTFQCLRDWSYILFQNDIIAVDDQLVYHDPIGDMAAQIGSMRRRLINDMTAYHGVAALATAMCWVNMESAATAYCGEEMIPIADSFEDHCNGTQGLFWWECPMLFYVIGMLVQTVFIHCLDTGKIRFNPSFTNGHKVLLMFLIWTGGCKWLLSLTFNFLWCYGQYKAGPVYVRFVRWAHAKWYGYPTPGQIEEWERQAKLSRKK
jgi:hypothetical protein